MAPLLELVMAIRKIFGPDSDSYKNPSKKWRIQDSSNILKGPPIPNPLLKNGFRIPKLTKKLADYGFELPILVRTNKI